MENSLSYLPEPKTEPEYEAALNELMLELRRHEEKMREDRLEIDRLKAESRVIGAHTDAVLSQVKAHLDRLQRVS